MKHKKIVIIGIILLAVSFIVMALFNSTYALFSSDVYGDNTNAYTTGMLLIEANSKSENISLDNILPVTDEEGLKTNPYVFTIKNIGNLDYLFDVKLLSTGDSSTTFSPQYIKLQIDDGDVITLSSLTNGIIKGGIKLSVGDSIDISIRVWLSIDTPNTELGKSFNSKIVTDGQAASASSNNQLRVNALQYITNLYNNANKTVVTNNGIEYNQAQSVSLMNDRLGGTTSGYNSGNIRYYGANPDNYIYFNCSDYYNQTDSTCEKWRIVGIIDGKVKLIKDKSIGGFNWDTNGSNNWKTSTLNTYLNGDYYSSLSTETQSLISNSTFYLGGYNSSSIYSNEIYKYERTNEEGTTILEGNPFTVDTNIGIMYASDYGYATDFNECYSKLIGYSDEECYSNDWLFNSNYQWVINLNSDSSSFAWLVSLDGYLDFYENYVTGSNGVRPVLYLDPEVMLGDGNGTSSNPYQIYIKPTKLIEHITNLYVSGNPTLKTQPVLGGSYYFSYQNDSETWGILNDGLKIADDSSVGATIITDAELLKNGEDGNIRYFGSLNDVKNYIYFNCSDYDNQSDSTCEKWRIVGIIDGKVKIIRDSLDNEFAWDFRGNNNWESSRLQQFLNGLYYNRGNETEFNHFYKEPFGNSFLEPCITSDIEKIAINDKTRGLISKSTWYLGGNDRVRSDGINPIGVYRIERKLDLSHSNPYSIEANIGLLYASDYAFSTDLSKCEESPGYYGDNLVDFPCGENSWLVSYNVNGSYQNFWFITPNNDTTRNVFYYTSDGSVRSEGSDVDYGKWLRPVLYLNKELTIKDGDGSRENPYQVLVE